MKSYSYFASNDIKSAREKTMYWQHLQVVAIQVTLWTLLLARRQAYYFQGIK